MTNPQSVIRALFGVGTALIVGASAHAAGPAPFPAVSHTYEAKFGAMAFRLEFNADGKTMRFAEAAAKDFKAVAETVSYTAVPIRAGVYMVYWTEKSGATVVHVEDFERKIVHTNITNPDRTFYNLSGTWTRVK